MPRIGRPACINAINVPNSGTPLMKDLVPSIGSSTQTNSASSRSRPYSSPKMPWSGNRALMSRRIAASAARSAAVTGLRSGLSSTAREVRKYGRITAPAASASSEARARYASNAATSSLFEGHQIFDDVGAVLLLRQPGEGHLGALSEILRMEQPDIELVRIPLLVLVLEQRGGEH